jgi:hypothetical protein
LIKCPGWPYGQRYPGSRDHILDTPCSEYIVKRKGLEGLNKKKVSRLTSLNKMCNIITPKTPFS